MGKIQHMSTYCQMHVGSCGYVSSSQAPTAAASRRLRVREAYPQWEAPGRILPGALVSAPGR
jgi:hypothetical protein